MAIINPNSGPDAGGPDSSYTTYMKQLSNAGVQMVGYVHTSWGDRALSDVQADIDGYASYPNLIGIFLDEASTQASDIPYYTSVYNYIKSKKGYTEVLLNPGTATAAGYMDISTNIMIYEDSAANFAKANLPSFVACAPSASEKAGYKYRFSAVAYGASLSQVSSLVSQMQNKGIGMVYITDASDVCCIYNSLASYFASEATTVAGLN